MSSVPPARLRAKALQWLAQREHSRAELQARLLRWCSRPSSPLPHRDHAATDLPVDGAAPTDPRSLIDPVLEALEREGWLSDERFAQSRIRLRQAGHGRMRIEHELRQHGLKLSAQQAQELAASELERATAALRRRWSGQASDPEGKTQPSAQAQAVDLKQSQRMSRYLASRGFSAEAVRAALKAVHAVPPETT